MPDISMCVDDECPSRFKCYRFMAEPSGYRQAYMDFGATRQGDRCVNFMELWTDAGRQAREDGDG